MKKIKSIEIAMENCESYIIPIDCVKAMWVKGFEKTLYITYGEEVQWDSVKEFSITLKDLDKITSVESFSKPFYQRLKEWSDITQIHITYESGKKSWFYVPWPKEENFINNWQKVKQNNDGSVYIKIKKCKKKKGELNE